MVKMVVGVGLFNNTDAVLALAMLILPPPLNGYP
jgi:hypothetical protein